ncbi:MAG TPA: hypothetical protein ENF94_00980 [Candidatus Woesearchaeota archaeon]|nr:MAG: hypothetical protein DRJ25_01325 [Candidatus Woesearchaeota archaeon]HDD70713.1 hypothetical protein [Candidatus Woesearchaeota archaeon]
MISPSMRLRWYKRKDVQEAIVEAAKDKEIAVKFGDKGFGKRPEVIKHPKDVLEFAKQGATSFHCSEELWDNPLNIVTGMRHKELNDLRIGWDLILDLDCPALEFSQVTAHVLIEALKYYGIHNFSVKFSGNHGFHIGVPFESFPEKVIGTPTKDLFPEGPRKIAAFLQNRSRSILSEMMLERYALKVISEKVGKPVSELLVNGKFDPYKVVDVDTILIAPRHLYRMPYSFNEKSGLVSVPIDPLEILSFDKSSARFNRVVVKKKFLERKKGFEGEARKLFIQAFDLASEEDVKKVAVTGIKAKVSKDSFERISVKIPEEFFPPCIKKGLKGLVDGRKRFLFILINFLSSVSWSFEEIEKLLFEWNERNDEPLRESVIRGQLNHKRGKDPVLPPNCDNKGYMVGMQICNPDNFCKKIKNPVNYAVFKFKQSNLFKKDYKKINAKKESNSVRG